MFDAWLAVMVTNPEDKMVTVLPDMLAIRELVEKYENAPDESDTGAVNANGAFPNDLDRLVKPDKVGVRFNTSKDASTIIAE